MPDKENENLTRRQRREARERPVRLALPFFIVLGLLAAVSFIIPLRPTESQSEKRALKEFPAFSTETLLSGDYFDDISAWFSDTFPGRERWMTLARAEERIHGVGSVAVYGEFTGGDEIPDVIPTPEPTAEPEPMSTPEPTPIPTLPPTPEVIETSPPEESVEHWGGIDDDSEAEVIFGNVLQIGDAAFAYYGFSQYNSDRHVAMVNHCADVMEELGIRVFDVLIPTSVGILVSSDFMEQIKCTDQGQSISYIFSQEQENVNKVNVFNTLIEHNDEYLYFRTDHHWTALGAYYSYVQFCSVAGLEAAPLESFTEKDMGPFWGSFYGQCNQNGKLRQDNVIAYDPPGDISMKITQSEGNTFPWTVLTDMSKSPDNSKYMCFLGGDNPLTVITNNDLPDGPSCVVIKDSFGNPFVPFLTQNYHTIYAIDYRKYSAMQLRYFVQYNEVDDVLLVDSLAMAQGSGTLDLMEWFTK